MSRVCIYYELEEVTRAHRDWVINQVEGDYIEIINAGASWLEGEEDTKPSILEFTEVEFQERMMDNLEKLEEYLSSSSEFSDLFNFNSWFLFEAARYDLMFDLTTRLKNILLANLIREKYDFDYLYWVKETEGKNEAAYSRELIPSNTRYLSFRNNKPVNYKTALRLRELKYLVWKAKEKIKSRCLKLASKYNAIPSSPSVLFIEFHRRHLQHLLSISCELEKGGEDVHWLATREQVAGALEDKQIPYSLLSWEISSALKKKIQIAQSQVNETISRFDTIPLSYWQSWGPADPTAIRDQIVDCFKKNFHAALMWLHCYEFFFKKTDSKAIVNAAYSNSHGRAAAIVANKLGIPSIYIQHGLFPECACYAKHIHSDMLLWGRSTKKYFVESGLSSEKIKVTGPTNSLSTFGEQELAQEIQTSRKIRVLYTASRTAGMIVSYQQGKSLLLSVLKLLEKIPQLELTIKPHPSDSTDLFKTYLPEHPNLKFVSEGSSIDLIKQNDLVLVVSSTTGLEACLLGKPLLILNMFGLKDLMHYEEYGAAVSVTKPDELAERINEIRESKQLQSKLEAGRKLVVDELLNGGKGNGVELSVKRIREIISAPTAN